MAFSIDRHRAEDGTVRLILRGELDIGTQHRLQAALHAEERGDTADLVVVTDQLDCLDSSSLRVLFDGFESARRAGRRFAVTPGHTHVHHLLRISGLLAHQAAVTS